MYRIASATWNVAFTIMVPIAFGAMRRSTIRALPPPITRTACTYSRTRRLSASPRTSRAMDSHAAIEMTRIMLPLVGLMIVVSTMSTNRMGMAMTASTMRIMTEAGQSPNQAILRPSRARILQRVVFGVLRSASANRVDPVLNEPRFVCAEQLGRARIPLRPRRTRAIHEGARPRRLASRPTLRRGDPVGRNGPRKPVSRPFCWLPSETTVAGKADVPHGAPASTQTERELSPFLEPHVKGVPEGVAYKVEGHHGEHDGDPGRVDEPPVAVVNVVEPIRQHFSPVRCRWWRTKSQV